MKKIRTLLLLLSAIFALTACQADNGQANKEKAEAEAIEKEEERYTRAAQEQKKPSSLNGVTIIAEKETVNTSDEEIYINIQNNSDEEFLTATMVFLEKKIEDTWYLVPLKNESYTDQAIIHPPGDSSLGIDTSELKYGLTPGKYRAVSNGLAAPFEVIE